MSGFELGFSLWAAQSSVSRDDFAGLREVLALPHTEEDVKRIPEKLDTLIDRLNRQLPLLPLSKKDIPVDTDVQPSRQNVPSSDPFHSSIYWYPPAMLFRNILSSELADRMHFGMAEYVDQPTELWHTRAWGSSIRAVSGQFASTSAGHVIFPSDFVSFESRQLATANISVKYGRITFIGIDKRTTSSTVGQIVLTLQPVVRVTDLAHCLENNDISGLSLWILIEDQQLELLVSAVQQPVSFSLSREAKAPISPYSIQHVFNMQQLAVRSTLKLHTLRAELELEKYGRAHFESYMASESDRSLSVPIQLFIDGFGVFRNTYRSLKGFYLTPACLPYSERRRERSIFTLTLGPHGADMTDIVKCFEAEIQDLEKGLRMKINGVETMVNVFIMALTGDMPQQAINSGFLSHNAKFGCRTCYCPEDKRGDLAYDVISNGRYHHQSLLIRENGNSKPTLAQQKVVWKENGFAPKPSPLEALAPALDLILSRTYDIPHSEWKGLGKNLHKLLLDSILTPSGVSGYTSAFLHFPVPAHWPRIQNPKTHFRSWSLSEHGRAIIVTPLILRCHAKLDWFKPPYLSSAGIVLSSLSVDRALSAQDLIVHAYACYAIAVSAVSTPTYMSSDELRLTVLKGREAYQKLIEASVVSQSSEGPPVTTLSDNRLKLPNVHVALHFSLFAAEYGPLMNSNVLPCEKFHK
jgi:hypothetical protein